MKKQFLNDIKLIFVPNDLTIKRLEKIDEIKKPKILLKNIKAKQPKIKKSKFLLFNFFENFSLFKEDNSLKKYLFLYFLQKHFRIKMYLSIFCPQQFFSKKESYSILLKNLLIYFSDHC